jgi:hypothetical protein
MKQDASSEVDAMFQDFHATGQPAAVDPKAPLIDIKSGESGWQYLSRALPEQAKFIGAQMRAHLGDNPKEQRAAFESMYGGENVKTQGNALYFRPDAKSAFRKVDQTLYNGMVDFALFHALQAPGLIANTAVQAAGDIARRGGAAALGMGAAGGAAKLRRERSGQSTALIKFRVNRRSGLDLPSGHDAP